MGGWSNPWRNRDEDRGDCFVCKKFELKAKSPFTWRSPLAALWPFEAAALVINWKNQLTSLSGGWFMRKKFSP